MENLKFVNHALRLLIMFSETDLDDIADYLKNVDGKIYIGCDSKRYRKQNKWEAKYVVVLICHINNKNGGKIFTAERVLPIYDDVKKPKMRLMQEVYIVVEAYQQLQNLLSDRNVEIHLDLNPDDKFVSNVALKEAMGYVTGVTSIIPKVKPHSWAGHAVADAGVKGRFEKIA
jgi:predicted RNase H-related nuclease YkuK (DUF458 family)